MKKAIAIDFDGCICTNAFPSIGEPNWDVIKRAKAKQRAGVGLILWTCREGDLLEKAVNACRDWGLTFDAVNESLPDWIKAFKNQPRKVGASEYWDDKAVNPTILNGTYVSREWFSQVNAELQTYKKADEARRLLLLPDVKYTDADGEEALRVASWTCGNRNNPITRYTLDAVAEKLCRDADQQREPPDKPLSLDELRRMDGEPVWVADLLIPECSCYHFVQKIGDHVLLMEPRYYPAEDVMIPHYCANDENQGYGRTWLAYRRKPEEVKAS